MSCAHKTIDVTQAVFSDGTTTNKWIPFITMPTNGVEKFKVTVNFESSSGLLSWRRGVAYSNDNLSFSSATVFGSASMTTEGWDYGDSWQSVDVDSQYMELGLACKNSTGSIMEMGRATIRVTLVNA